MIRVLFVIDSLGPAGKERQLVETVKGLSKRPDFKITLVLLNNYIHYKDIKNIKCKLVIIERAWKKDPLVFFKLYNICNKFKPHIIHSWERMCSIYAFPIAKLLKAKFINGVIQNTTLYNNKHTKRWWEDKITFYFSDKIVSNTATGLKNYRIPNNKGSFVYNGFDFKRLDKIQPSELVRKKFDVTTPYVIGMVARFDYRKDYNTFIKCAIEIVKKRNDVTFMAVGQDSASKKKGPHNAQYYKDLVPSEYKEKIIFTGPQTEIESIINIFTIGILLTNFQRHGEGISNSIMEYLALNKPVIATDYGGTPEIIKNGINGFLISQNDPRQIVQKIDDLLADSDLRNKMGQHGYNLIVNKFNLEVMTRNFITLYDNVLT